MNALPLLTLWLATAAPAHPCFTPSDQTAGWKRVSLPDEAPALAAPTDLEQFRSGEPVLLLEQDPAVYLGVLHESPGRMTYRFRLPPESRRLELGFLEGLRGAKVDAMAYDGFHAFVLLDERRVEGAQLTLAWDMSGVNFVEVTVHHHLRSKPVVRTWQVARQLKARDEPSLSAAFRVPRSLYYLHPGGRRVDLCDVPGLATPSIHPPSGEPPREVTLSPR